MNEKLFNTPPHTHTQRLKFQNSPSTSYFLRSSRFSILLLVSIFSIFPHFHERTRTECCCLWILMSCGRTSRKQAARWRGRKSTKFIPTVAIQSISHPTNAIFIQHLIIISVNVAHGAVSEATHHLGCLEDRALPPPPPMSHKKAPHTLRLPLKWTVHLEKMAIYQKQMRCQRSGQRWGPASSTGTLFVTPNEHNSRREWRTRRSRPLQLVNWWDASATAASEMPLFPKCQQPVWSETLL